MLYSWTVVILCASSFTLAQQFEDLDIALTTWWDNPGNIRTYQWSLPYTRSGDPGNRTDKR